MTHKSGHLIVDFAETKIPKTPIKVRDILGAVAGGLLVYLLF